MVVPCGSRSCDPDDQVDPVGASGRAEPRRGRAGHDDGLLDEPRVPGPSPSQIRPLSIHRRCPGDERLGEHHQLGAQVDGLGDELLHASHRGVAVEQHVRRLDGRHGEAAGHRVPDSTCSSQGPTNPSPVSYSREGELDVLPDLLPLVLGTPDSIWWRAPNDSRSNRTQSAAEGSRKRCTEGLDVDVPEAGRDQGVASRGGVAETEGAGLAGQRVRRGRRAWRIKPTGTEKKALRSRRRVDDGREPASLTEAGADAEQGAAPGRGSR